VKQIYPASITGKGHAAGGSVLEHSFGRGDPYTLGVEEEFMLLDPETSTSSSTSTRCSERWPVTSSRRTSIPS
jgi:hypothetical protein